MARTGPSARSGSRAGGTPRAKRSAGASGTRPSSGPGSAGKVAAARDRIVRSVLAPLNAVLLTRRHIEEVLDDAVSRGRMTRSDAQEMAQSLLSRSARATDDFLSDVERMLGSRGDDLESAPVSERGLPIAGYDDLSAAQVQDRLDGLTPAELRRLRDYEQRHANRKTVLDRIDRKLR
jgi:polyhydroxyalkanoate synthesis regulator phasin